MADRRHVVFVTGGTGYLGSRLVADLLSRGHTVRALARPGSERRLPAGAQVVLGDALQAETFSSAITPADTLVHLVGTPRPSPAKAALVGAVEQPASGLRVIEVAEIQAMGGP